MKCPTSHLSAGGFDNDVENVLRLHDSEIIKTDDSREESYLRFDGRFLLKQV